MYFLPVFTPTEVETVLVAIQVEHRDEDVIARLLARTLAFRAPMTDFIPTNLYIS
jgi:hypothetical protein